MEDEAMEKLAEETVVGWDPDVWDDDGWESDRHSLATTAPFTHDDTATDCTHKVCSYPLTTSSLLKYQVNVPEGMLSMELMFDGESWFGLASSKTGGTVSSEAIMQVICILILCHV